MLDTLEIPTPLGFLNRAEMQAVTAMGNNMEQMDKVIELLLGKEDKCFSNFCDVLTKSNNEVWAGSLRKKAQELQQRSSGKCLQHFVWQLLYILVLCVGFGVTVCCVLNFVGLHFHSPIFHIVYF